MKTKFVMASFLSAVIICAASLRSFSQEPQWKWVKTAGDATFKSSASDTLGNIVSIGSFMGAELNFGTLSVAGSPAGETTSMYIVKYNSAGGIVWAQSIYGTETNSMVRPVKVVVNNRGEIAVICHLFNAQQLSVGKYSFSLKDAEEKLLVFTMTQSGRFVWLRLLEPKSQKIPGVEGSDMAIDNIGNVYCTGSYSADTLFAGKEYLLGEGPSTFLFVAAFNPLGSLDWIRTCGIDDSSYISNIKSRFLTLAVDGIIIAGDYQGKRDYYFNTSVLQKDTSLTAFVAKLSYTGDFAWAKRFSGNLTDFSDGIATDIMGNTYVTGVYNSFLLSADTLFLTNFSGNYNLFVSKLLPDGSIGWLKNIDIQLISYDVPGRNSYFKTDVIGNITLVTHYMGKSVLSNVFTRPNALEGTRDLLAVRLDNTDGSVRWVHTGNSVSDDWLSSVTFDIFGSTYILGRLINNIAYDSLSLTDAAGYGGFYIVKINYQGEIKYGKANINGADGYLTGQRILADPFGNIYLNGNYSGVANMLGDIVVSGLGNAGLFISKFSYITSISGTVWNIDGSPMQGGMVKVFGYTRFQRSPLSDSTLINENGGYILNRIPFGRYILYAKPNSSSNPKAVPTYYSSASNWQNSTPIVINSSEPYSGLDIYLREIPEIAGTNSLGGLVFEDDTTNVFKSSSSVQAKPVRKANVVLVGKSSKTSDDVIAYTTTDDEGNFAFYNISDGDYTIIVDIPGMPHASYYDVTVTGGQLIMNLDHLVGEETITAQYGTNSLPQNRISEGISVYPNPSSGLLYIKNKNMPSEIAHIEIFELSGACAYSKSMNLAIGINTLNISILQSGIYLLKITSSSVSYYEKLLVR